MAGKASSDTSTRATPATLGGGMYPRGYWANMEILSLSFLKNGNWIATITTSRWNSIANVSLCTASMKSMKWFGISPYSERDWEILESHLKKLYWQQEKPGNTTAALHTIICSARNGRVDLKVYILQYETICNKLRTLRHLQSEHHMKSREISTVFSNRNLIISREIMNRRSNWITGKSSENSSTNGGIPE